MKPFLIIVLVIGGAIATLIWLIGGPKRQEEKVHSIAQAAHQNVPGIPPGSPPGAFGQSPLAQQPEPPQPPPLPFSYVFTKRTLPPSEVLQALIASPAVKIIPDPPTNSVMVLCPEDHWFPLGQSFTAIDFPVKEAFVDASVFFVSGDSVDSFEATLSYQEGTTPTGIVSLTASALGAVVPIGAFAVQFDFMRSQGLLQVMDRPQIRLSNGIPSEVRTGEEIPLPVVNVAGSGLATNSIQYKRVGLTFRVTPTFFEGDSVRLDMDLENGLVGNPVNVNGTEIPIITTQGMKAAATLGMGDALVIGGLETVRSIQRKGFLSDSETKQSGRLYVVLTLRSAFPRAIVLPEVPDPQTGFEHPLLPAKGLLDRIKRNVRENFPRFGPRSK